MADALRSNYGILTSIASGSGFKTSLKLVIYRRTGTDRIVSYQLYRADESQMKLTGTDNASHYYTPIEDEAKAQDILLENADLMRAGLTRSQPSGFRKFFETVVDIILTPPPGEYPR